jgi:hypothetical protein
VCLGILAAVAITAAGCRGGRITSSVTCDGLRALHLGMDQDTVMKLLGPPLSSTGQHPQSNPEMPDERWSYGSESFDPYYLFSYTDRFYADFRQGRLVEVNSFRKLDPSPPQPPLFDLRYEKGPDGKLREIRREPSRFRATFCP